MGSPPSRAAAELAAKKRAKERADAKAETRRRRAGAPWFEWMLEEFARYLYVLGVVAALIFVPLQMADSWLPGGVPPIMEPAVVAGLAIAYEVAAVLLAFLAYRFLWHEAGPVARAIARLGRKASGPTAAGPEAALAVVPSDDGPPPKSPSAVEVDGPSAEPVRASAVPRSPEGVPADGGGRARTPWLRRWRGLRRRR